MNAPASSPWINPPGKTPVFLLDTSSRLEYKIALDWIRSSRPEKKNASVSHRIINIGSWVARKKINAIKELATLLESEESNLFFIPVRVLWFPKTVNGERRARLRDVIIGDPRNPLQLNQLWIHHRDPSRCYPVVADGSDTQDLIARFIPSGRETPSEIEEKAGFILRMAALALERAERRERGARYKVPRLVKEAILGRPEFVRELKALAHKNGMIEDAALAEATNCLHEMAADHSSYFIDMLVSVSRFLCSRGYDRQIDYLPEEVERIREMTQRHPVAFLMTHKTYLDGLVMARLVYELDFPPLHLVGGANLNFIGAGKFARKSGTIFIRRSFGNDPVYKLVFRHYIKYLVEKRFPLNWAFEGTRSRTGKLMPPRFGMLSYVVEAAMNLDNTRLHLLPVNIAYDQLPDISDYISEQRGQVKKKESWAWLKQYFENVSRPYGRIHVRFGKPVIVEGRQPGETAKRKLDQLELQKLSFQVAVEANRVTPITPTALISFCLLAHDYKALTLRELLYEVQSIEKLINLYSFPKASNFDFSSADKLLDTLRGLVANDVLTCYEEGAEKVFSVAAGYRVAIAYYRNTIVHFFVNCAIAELAIIAASVPELRTLDDFHQEALKIRDVFKFEFFFLEKNAFLETLDAELELRLPGWSKTLQEDPYKLNKLSPVVAHCTLRTFVDAYQVVADVLVLDAGKTVFNKKLFFERCMSLGKQMVLQQRIASDDSVNRIYFENALKLAESRELLKPESADLRKAFSEEIGDIKNRLDLVAAAANRNRFTQLSSLNRQAIKH